jgi:predicted amidohydrolase
MRGDVDVDEVMVACCQLELAIGAVAANREAGRAAIVEAASQGAQVVVLPELASSGYVFEDEAEARHLAEPLDGQTVTAWHELAAAHDLVIVGGICERDPGEARPRNSAVVVDRDGVRAVYRKAHLWDREGLVFAAGAQPPPVLDTAYGRIAVIVCYDLEFPEWVRLPALQAAELLCVPTNWPREPRPPGERPAEVIRAQAGAGANRMFIAVCDRAGVERGVRWCNGTSIIGPDGYPLAGPVGEDRAATIAARCRLKDARDKSIGPRNDVLADRRPQLYGAVSR